MNYLLLPPLRCLHPHDREYSSTNIPSPRVFLCKAKYEAMKMVSSKILFRKYLKAFETGLIFNILSRLYCVSLEDHWLSFLALAEL